MRITGGTMRGRVLASKVSAGVRPTSSRVREAMFSIIGQDLAGVSVLDAFGGSGLLSFEALSRGATVTTAERNRNAVRSIMANADQLGVGIDLRNTDVRGVLATASWDVVIMDPPYSDDPVEWVAEAASAVDGMLVIEHRSELEMPPRVGALSLEKQRRYGDSTLSVYRRRALTQLDKSDVVP